MIVSLYDVTGIAVQPWIDNGFMALIADQLHERDSEDGLLVKISGDLRQRELDILEMLRGLPVHLLCSFPPCTDLSVSGACRFTEKADRDPFFQQKALDLVFVGTRMGETLGCPYFIENPIGVLSTLWRKPDFSFHPFEYGGYLDPATEYQHPLFPHSIAPLDAYKKLTCLWTGGGFTMPALKPVKQFDPQGLTRQMAATGGRSPRTKMIRSATPRGFAKALYEQYSTREPDVTKSRRLAGSVL